MKEALESKYGPRSKGPRIYSLTFSLERIKRILRRLLW